MAKVQLPKVNVKILSDYPSGCSNFSLPPNYIKYIEKTNEELDEEVEYDMDEEDNVWLKLISEQFAKENTSNQSKITQEQFELLMDRLEKESYFQSAASSLPTTSSSSLSSSSTTNENVNPNGNQANNSLDDSKINNDSANDDALCCICLDGECLNSNEILFCDMCNLAVHQECYGVPYIPEGQWLCRRCILSPSAPVNCILCPNNHGAFKQTDKGLWTHVVCAIWIPEVHFANTVFLEPVIGIENIDRARWKLMCYICRKRNVGACIQCDKQNCYTAFHVTCAQQAGLYMNIQEEVIDSESSSNRRKKSSGSRCRNVSTNNPASQLTEVRRCAYCDIHTPLEVLSPRTRKSVCGSLTGVSAANMSAEIEEAMKRAQKLRMKKARKILAERRNAPPVICMPVIPKEKIQDIMSKIDQVENKEKFFEKIMNYWLMKRYSRNGVPLLRRLQHTSTVLRKCDENKPNGTNNESTNQQQTINSNSSFNKTNKESSTKTNDGVVTELADSEKKKIYEQLKEQLINWKRLRQDLERARLLMELIRKRERLKRECIRISHLESVYQLCPLNGIFLQSLLDILREMDKNKIFHEPVDSIEVPTYYETIKNPMDFSKMQAKLNNLEYNSLTSFEADLNLIINNCLEFNQKNSYFYKAAVKLRDQSSNLLKQAKRIYENNEFVDSEETNNSNKLLGLIPQNCLTLSSSTNGLTQPALNQSNDENHLPK